MRVPPVAPHYRASGLVLWPISDEPVDVTDVWNRARPGSDVAEHLVLAGAFDALYGIGAPRGVGVRGAVTRRDLPTTRRIEPWCVTCA